MKNKILPVLISLLLTTACQQNSPTTNQNSPPTVSPTVLPTVSISENRNAANVSSTPDVNASQTPKTTSTASPTPKPSVLPTVAPTLNAPRLKNYTAKGVIKKIDAENNSVTIDHEDIGDYMVGMEMPFPVVNRNVLSNLKVGDSVTFVLETGVGVERIISIKKN